MKGLKALGDLRNCLQAYYTMENVPNIDNNLNVIEKELKALEILKPLIWVADYKGTYYLVVNNEGIQIDREKYELLEEALK